MEEEDDGMEEDVMMEEEAAVGAGRVDLGMAVKLSVICLVGLLSAADFLAMVGIYLR